MYQLIFPAFLTTLTFLFDLRSKYKRELSDYFALFILLAGVNYLFSAFPLQADSILFKERYLTVVNGQIVFETKDNTKTDNTKIEKKTLKDINKQFMKDCRDKMDYHFEQGLQCFKDAEEACLWFPDVSEQEKAKDCFLTFIATMQAGDSRSKLLVGLITICGTYVTEVMTAWHRIDYKLREAKYHWEMEEHYRLIGKRMQDELNSEKY